MESFLICTMFKIPLTIHLILITFRFSLNKIYIKNKWKLLIIYSCRMQYKCKITNIVSILQSVLKQIKLFMDMLAILLNHYLMQLAQPLFSNISYTIISSQWLSNGNYHANLLFFFSLIINLRVNIKKSVKVQLNIKQIHVVSKISKISSLVLYSYI